MQHQSIPAGADGFRQQRAHDVHLQPQRRLLALPGMEPPAPHLESPAGPQAHVRLALLPQIPNRQDGPHQWGERESRGTAVAWTRIFMESPSGIKLILVTHPRTGDLRESLKYIYNLYVEYVVKNPLYTPGTPIRCELFNTTLDQYFYTPSPPIGHLISMVELGKFILRYYPSLCIHILITTVPYNSGSTGPYIATVSTTFPSIQFHHLPTVTLPFSTTTHHETLTFEVLRLSNPHVHQALLSISKTYTVRSLVMDFFCTAASTVASELNIPGYHFFTSGAGCLASFLNLPTIHQNTTASFKDLDILLDIPGVPPLPASDMPKPVLNRDDKSYQYFLDFTSRFPESAGIVVNTFEALEPRAVKAITDGLCVRDNRTPPIYCIGPLIAEDNNKEEVHECLTWLDLQPKQSVVFLCFGSLGLFSKEQLTEIAIGLENSGQRFLWVVRNPPCNDQTLAITAQPDPDLESSLPQGFLDRTKERGLVMKSWAPQVAVLSHESVGGFVSHCGWNSVLEAVRGGVPIVAWPLYAEQRINRVLLVEEMRLALRMNESEDGFVSAGEVEKRVRESMESEEGKAVRERAIAMKGEAKAALSEDGASRVALSKFVESWKR
ncbi:hypothetical protein Tsubulata_006033 [Turnera subulata]|uniref:anthocyanidin 3-O-glucosyltransferase n=1 Tax=Turnera subulata TaxID=218843 RepID=A0A9Q0GA38_9ROSI|nr:hypothetical protein Tsubulata_006033 [Turnera subulata]